MNNSDSILDKIQPEQIDMSDVYNVDDVEKQLELEAKKILKAKQQKQMQDMRDTRYYAVVVFGNKADKEKWLETLQDVEVEGETFIDGYQLAKKYGTEIEMSASLPEPHYVKSFKIKKNGK